MAKQALAQRVAQLERQMAQITINGLSPRQALRRMMAKYEDDVDLLELFKEAVKIREADRAGSHAKPRVRRAAV